jgi:hypothetical protein
MKIKIDKVIDYLFVSKVRIKALEYFLMHPDDEIHLRGAVRQFGEEVNSVRRELDRLVECNILKSENKGNRKYYELNGNSPIINELISMMHKFFGLGAEIIQCKNKLGNIEYAFLTPSYTKGIFMGIQIIDLVIVGDINLEELSKLVNKHQEFRHKEIHYMVLKSSEFLLKKRRRDQMIVDLLMQDNVLLIGNRDNLVRV